MLNKTKPAIENDGSRKRPLASVGVLALAVLLTTALIMTASSAAFFDTTVNTGNTWSAGTVILTDDDAGSAMFTVTNMSPLATVTECIVVTYSGTMLPSDVNLYGVSGGTGLDAYLDVTVEEGTGGIFGDCSDGAGFTPTSTIFATNTLNNFATNHTNFANGVGAWNPAANPESRTYRFTVTLQDNNLAQGLNATATFTWEAQA